MARKGNYGKNASTGGTPNPKQDNAKAKEVLSKDEKSKGKSPSKKGPVQSEAAKKPTLNNLGGFIFMCNGSTKADCFKHRVFGLNEGKKNLVEQVRKGMRLFLFDIDLRLLYGIYVAASQGSYKIEREAFGGAFPWQVRFSIQKDCLPLPEDVFQAAIKENYVDNRKFKVELTIEQVHRLVKLFRPLPGSRGRSPPRQRMAAPDQFEVAAKAKVPRYPEIDRYGPDKFAPRRLSPRRLSPRAKYEADYIRRLSPRAKYETDYISSDLRRLPPIAKYESKYTSSDRYGAEKQISGYSQSLTKYAQLYPPEERRVPDGRVSDDPYLGRELRLQQELAQHGQIGAGSLAPVHSLAPSSLSAYSADPLRPLSDLRQRARDDLYSLYPQGSTLSADIDPLLRQRLLVPDARADVLDRRVGGLDPLVESSLAYTGTLSTSDLLRGRPSDIYSSSDIYASSAGYGGLHRLENGSGLMPGGVTGASGLAYRGDLLPQSRYYGSSGY